MNKIRKIIIEDSYDEREWNREHVQKDQEKEILYHQRLDKLVIDNLKYEVFLNNKTKYSASANSS